MTNKRKKPNVMKCVDHIAAIKKLNKTYIDIKDGYRDGLYAILQGAAEIIYAVSKSDKIKNTLNDCNVISIGINTSISNQIMYAVEGAKSRREKKRAQKHARVITYLMKSEGLKPQEVAEALREHGGVEKVNKLSAGARKKKSRNDAGDLPVRSGEVAAKILPPARAAGKKGGVTASMKSQRHRKDECDDVPAAKPRHGSKARNHRHDNWPTLMLRIDPEYFQKLDEANDNQRFKLVGHMRGGCFVAAKAVRLKLKAPRQD